MLFRRLLSLYSLKTFIMVLIKSVLGKTPSWGKSCFLADNATLIGDVIMGDQCSVWFNAVIRGDVNYIRIGTKVNIQDGVVIHSHLSTEKMYEAIMSSDVVLSRPGYSTIMDLAALGKKAVFVPTPGQTEQEYLAGMLKKRGLFYSESQHEFKLDAALTKANEFSGIKIAPNPSLLKDAVQKLLSRI